MSIKPTVKSALIAGGALLICFFISAIYIIGLKNPAPEKETAQEKNSNQKSISPIKEIPGIFSNIFDFSGKIIKISSDVDFIEGNLFKIIFSKEGGNLTDLLNNLKTEIDDALSLIQEIENKNTSLENFSLPGINSPHNLENLKNSLNELNEFIEHSLFILNKPRLYFLFTFQSSSVLGIWTLENGKIASTEIEETKEIGQNELKNTIEIAGSLDSLRKRSIIFEGAVIFTEAKISDYENFINQLSSLDAQQTKKIYNNIKIYFKDPELDKFINGY